MSCRNCLAMGVLASLFLHTSCTRTSAQRVIGVTLLTREHFFYQELERGLREEATRRGYSLLVNSGDWDLARQQAQIQDFVTRRVSAMVVCPVNFRGVGPAIQEARAAGIPVFTADIRAESATVVSHIASDNRAGGRLAGEFLVRRLAGRKPAKIAIIHQPFTQTALERVAGFREAVEKHPHLKIVAAPNGDGVRDRALRAAEDLLQAFPDLDAIFGINDDSALGAVAAIEAAGRRDILVVGFDATPEARQKIQSGSVLQADVAQDPREMGRRTIEVIDRHLKGEKVPEFVPVPVKLVEK